MRDATRRLIEETLEKTESGPVRGLVLGQGPELRQFVVDQLLSASGASHAFVGELTGENLECVEVLAIQTRGPERDRSPQPFAYLLEGAPCEKVLGGEVCIFPVGVAAQFPRDRLLTDLAVEGYIGVCLSDEQGRPLGLLAVLFREPIDPEEARRSGELLEAWAPRVATDLSYRRAIRDLREVFEVTASTGDEVLWRMTEALARRLGVSGAFIVDADGQSWRTRALCYLGKRYPTLLLAENQPLDDPKELEATHPILLETRARHLHTESFPGGWVGLLNERPFIGQVHNSPVFQAFRHRVMVELGRLSAESERRSAEAALLAAQRRESLGLLAGGIAHDFNNLLVSILGNADMLASDGVGEVKELAEDIVLAARRATELSQQLLAYAGRRNLVKAHIDFVALVKDLVRLVKRRIPPEVELCLDVACGGAAWVLGDSAQLQQVVINLVTNAVEAVAGREGHVRLSLSIAQSVHVEGMNVVVPPRGDEGPYIQLQVIDDGYGMSPETQTKIFEPFFTTKQSGHGLGLSAAQGIVRDHGGALLVRSQENQGSAFQVYFPISSPPPQTEA